MTQLFADAAEAERLGGPIARLYRTGLARKPDARGLRETVQRLRQGESLQAIATGIASSAEFQARHGPDAPPDDFFIRELFRSGLGRAADPEALQDFTARAAMGATRVETLLLISESAEARARTGIAEILFEDGLPPGSDLAYQLWLARQKAPDDRALAAAEQHVAELERAQDRTPVGLLLAVPPVRPDLLNETVDSLARQLWTQFELLLVCPPGLPHAARAAAETLAARVPQARLVEAGSDDAASLAAAGLDAAAAGHVGFIDAGDSMPETALAQLAEALADCPEAVLVYADEDAIDGAGCRREPRLKPGWSPDLALAGDFAGQPALFSLARLREIGGIDRASAPHHRYALLLRATAGVPRRLVRHVPALLYHRGRMHPERPPPFPALTSADPSVGRIANAELARAGSPLRVEPVARAGGLWPRLVVPAPAPHPLVSIIIPTKDAFELLARTTRDLLDKTDYGQIELVLVDNGTSSPRAQSLLRRLAQDRRVRVVAAPGQFNWSKLNNQGVAASKGPLLLLLNNDVEVVEPGWLTELVAQVMRPDVGVVGARLLYPGADQRLQHGGVTLGPGGSAVHVMRHATPDQAGPYGELAMTRDVAAVTGACLMIRRHVFDAVGGIDETLRVAWSDIDLCLRVRDAGYRIVWTPDATLIHVELATRGRDATPAAIARHEGEQAAMRHRWGRMAETDPFLNPALDATETAIVLRAPTT